MSNLTCKVDGCFRRSRVHGLCTAHYERKRKGKSIGGSDDVPYPRGGQQTIARIIAKSDVAECVFWPFRRDQNGYARFAHQGRDALVHQFVCRVAHGDPGYEGAVVRHLCGRGNLGCVNPNHLAWGSCKENQADRLAHGTHNRGQRCAAAKLTWAQVRKIRAYSGGVTCAEIAREFGVSAKTIRNIRKNKSWVEGEAAA